MDGEIELKTYFLGRKADMVEVVRCKDCINKECFGRDGKIVCDLDGFLHDPDWFCADGERKDGDGDGT